MSISTTSCMERAFELAQEALSAGEVPVGCVFYLPGIAVLTKKFLLKYNLFLFRNWHHWAGS